MSKLYVDEIRPKTDGNQVIMPERPFIKLKGNLASEATTHGTTEIYTNWDVEDSKDITWNSSNGRITVPVDGLYLLTPTFYIWANNAASHSVIMRINGTAYQEYILEFVNFSGRIDETIGQASTLNLSANDYIDFSCAADIYGGTNHTKCQMVYLG
jgi:hypothetical protein